MAKSRIFSDEMEERLRDEFRERPLQDTLKAALANHSDLHWKLNRFADLFNKRVILIKANTFKLKVTTPSCKALLSNVSISAPSPAPSSWFQSDSITFDFTAQSHWHKTDEQNFSEHCHAKVLKTAMQRKMFSKTEYGKGFFQEFYGCNNFLGYFQSRRVEFVFFSFVISFHPGKASFPMHSRRLFCSTLQISRAHHYWFSFHLDLCLAFIFWQNYMTVLL